MSGKAGKVGGAAAVGKRLGVTRRTVFNLEKIGMPKIGPGRYDLNACEKWYSDYSAKEGLPPEVAVQRARWIRAKADREEIQLARDRGELVRVDEVSRTWERLVSACRSSLLLLPSRLPPPAVGGPNI